MVVGGDALEWHREKQFKYAVLKKLAQIMLAQQVRGNKRGKGSLADSLDSGCITSSLNCRPSVCNTWRGGAPAAEVEARLHRQSLEATLPPMASSSEKTSRRNWEREASERLGVRRMKIADEIRISSTAGERLCMYLSEEYLELPVGTDPGESIYVQLQSKLSAMGVQACPRPHITTHYSLPATCCLLLTTHYSLLLLNTQYSVLNTQYSILDARCSLLNTQYSLLTTHYAILTTHYPLLTTHYSLLTAHYTLYTAYCILHTTSS